MTAQPMPTSVQIDGGIDVKSDDVSASRPQRILNAHYARTGALSKRFGYEATGTSYGVRDLPQSPLPGNEDGYLSFDGDKYFARKNRNGVDFYQRPDGRNVGNAGTQRPQLSQLPGYRCSDALQDMLVDVARTPQDFNSWSGSRDVIFYARMELNSFNQTNGREVYDVVVDYIDAKSDTVLSVRAETRIVKAIEIVPQVRHHIRLMTGRAYPGAPDGLILVYVNDHAAAPGRGIYYRTIAPGPTPADDVIGPEYCIVNTSSAIPCQLGRFDDFNLAAAPDCDTPFDDGGIGVCYAAAGTGTLSTLAFAKVRTSGNLTATLSTIYAPPNGFVTSIAMTAITNGIIRETAWSIVVAVGTGTSTVGSTQRAAYVGKFQYTSGGVPSTLTSSLLVPSTDNLAAIGPMTAVAGSFGHHGSGSFRTAFIAGCNSAVYGFRFFYSDKGQAAFYDTTFNAIDCAWATGRPFSLYNETGDWTRSVLPMVSWSAELGGGPGLFVDITPPVDYDNGVARQGGKLLATYAIDQVTLATRQVTLTQASVQVYQTYTNERVELHPSYGSHATYGAEELTPGKNRVRWLVTVGQPATPVLVALQENATDFEFIEPGVMLVGPGVPVLLDPIQGLSEIGFHTSPGLMQLSTAQGATGSGWPAASIVQFRFQYRFVDGFGRAQVSPATEPVQVTAYIDRAVYTFKLAALDATLRSAHVLLDVYRTDPSEATFFFIGSFTAEGGESAIYYTDWGPTYLTQAHRAQTINVESYWMTPPCASHAFRGAFRDILVTRENELWPSNRRLSTTAPQFDIVNAGGWDSYEPVVAGGEIDGKLILFSKSKIAYSYEMNGALAPFTDIPSDTGALLGSRAFNTHLGVFYQSLAGIRVIGRDMAIHETGLPIQPLVQGLLIRGGIKVPDQGEIRLRLDDGLLPNHYVVFDYFHGNIDQPVWYEFVYNPGDLYTADDGSEWRRRQFVDQAFAWNGRLVFLCRSGDLLMERLDGYKDISVWTPMVVRTSGLHGRTPISYLSSIEGAVNLERDLTNETPSRVSLRLRGDYEGSRTFSPILVQKTWPDPDSPLTVESFNRRQIQITGSEELMNAPAVSLEYDDTPIDPLEVTSGDGFGYRLSAMVLVTNERDQKTIFPVANGARK